MLTLNVTAHARYASYKDPTLRYSNLQANAKGRKRTPRPHGGSTQRPPPRRTPADVASGPLAVVGSPRLRVPPTQQSRATRFHGPPPLAAPPRGLAGSVVCVAKGGVIHVPSRAPLSCSAGPPAAPGSVPLRGRACGTRMGRGKGPIVPQARREEWTAHDAAPSLILRRDPHVCRR